MHLPRTFPSRSIPVPPLASPVPQYTDARAYSLVPSLFQALEEMAARNDGYVSDPREPEGRYLFSKLRKVFIS